ncbi:hypothetical protein [Micromonospora thermarum]|uniref:Uncharacterized protein n=1 Tax=Micromonospora thermarum TaxID=2720024 RepID=A0ABX0ZEZ8_9ACTN|nr:hypothetical protein [Micromonospora thermarum]NJP34641.1 hypothetical protein [Micromonospora thermarum]
MSDQGKTYAAFIEAELKAERDRRTAFDARGVALVTTSGSLVTLLTAVVAFFRVGTDFEFPRSATGPLVFALVALTAAAVAGILASWNRLYEVPKPATLAKLLNDRWAVDSEIAARNFVGTMQVLTIGGLRKGNNWKATCLSLGLVAQVVALLALSVVVYLMLRAYA